MDNAAMTEFFDGQHPDDYRDQCTVQCDECGIRILPSEKANPAADAETVCVLCWPMVRDEWEDVETTTTIPAQTMRDLVFGEVA